ncbi:MAG: ATP synthase F1 subunit gamma [Candidatus Omnitrophica bacterium CG1_02_46_14]|nr:MAG: ATP synthase F1 subunit gamma [Candidatus Omnitrophica bacterium CG1_02_46_14]
MKSIDNIHEITKAMEMIAAFRFKRAEGRFSKSKAYLGEMETLVANLSGSVENLPSPLFEKRPVRKKTLVVITADKGLCGSYNTNLLRAGAAWREENKDFETSFIPVGKVGHEALKKRHHPILLGYPERSQVDLALAKKITGELKNLFLSRQVDSIEFLYTTYHAGGMGRIHFAPFLSLGYLINTNPKGNQAPEYIYEPDFETVFLSLLARYLEGKIYLTLLESLTSEYSARMIAMKQATDNSEEILDDLKLLRNKTRQATITRELSEIVSGASVLV